HDAALGVVERRANFDQIAVGDADFLGRAVVHDDLAVTGNVLGHFPDELEADVAAPGVLHAMRGDQPEWIITDADVEVALEGSFPFRAEIPPMRHRFVFRELLVPPVDAVFVQSPSQLLADAEQAFLIRLLEAQAGADEFRIEVPLQPRERLHPKTVLAEIVQTLRFLAVGELGAGGAAYGVPDRLGLVHLFWIDGKVVIRTCKFYAGGA